MEHLSRTFWLLFYGVSAGILMLFALQPDFSDPPLEVSALNVGQGDAFLIRTPERKTVLIDAGIGSIVLEELGRKMKFFNKTIDLFVSTHPDRDHFGGALDVLDYYTIKKVLLTGTEEEDAYYQEFLARLRKQKAGILFANADADIRIGPDLFLDVLNPDAETHSAGVIVKDKNEASIVARLVRLTKGGWDPLVLFTGDAPIRIEREILAAGNDVRAPILKLGHHGSKTSTSPEWVAAVRPTTALISAGLKNRYGHPHPETLERLSGVEIRRTDQEGAIHVTMPPVLKKY